MSTLSRSTTPSVSESGVNVVRVPSYQRGTVASTGKRRTKVVPKPKPEPKLSSGGGRRKKRMEVPSQEEGYMELTHAALAEIAPRSYVLEGVRVEVPGFALVEFDASEDDKAWFAEAMEAKARPAFEVDLLFLGRHAYHDDQGAIVERRAPWKEDLFEKTGVDWNLFRLRRSLGLQDDVDGSE